MRGDLARRIRWGNVARAAAALGVLALVIAWPRLASPPPQVPGGVAVPVVRDDEASSRGESAGPRRPQTMRKRPRIERRRHASAGRRRETTTARRQRVSGGGPNAAVAPVAPSRVVVPAPAPSPPVAATGPAPADTDPATLEFGPEG